MTKYILLEDNDKYRCKIRKYGVSYVFIIQKLYFKIFKKSFYFGEMQKYILQECDYINNGIKSYPLKIEIGGEIFTGRKHKKLNAKIIKDYAIELLEDIVKK